MRRCGDRKRLLSTFQTINTVRNHETRLAPPRGTASNSNSVIVNSIKDRIQAWIKLLRPHQYAKNALVFVPFLTSHAFTTEALIAATTAFVAFCCCASSVYIVNDILDRESDRRHPSKRHRPLAAGILAPLQAGWLALALLVAGLALAAPVSWSLSAVLIGYSALSLAYSFWLKRAIVLDIVVLGILYGLRLFAGAIAIGVILSPWLLAFSIFMLSGLAVLKRRTELILRRDLSLSDSLNRGYKVKDIEVLPALACGAGFNAVTLFALYITSDAVRPLYSRPWLLWFICPLLIYGFGRMLLLANPGLVDDDPIVFAFTDRASLVLALLMLLAVLAAI